MATTVSWKRKKEGRSVLFLQLSVQGLNSAQVDFESQSKYFTSFVSQFFLFFVFLSVKQTKLNKTKKHKSHIELVPNLQVYYDDSIILFV